MALRREDPIVVSLPYGALEVADEIADHLQAPLRLILTRKVHAPQAHHAISAITERGPLGLTSSPGPATTGDSEDQVALETVELYRRSSILRRWAPPVAVVRRTVIVVDDGSSRRPVVSAALSALRAERPGKVLFASPVVDSAMLEAVSKHVTDVVYLVRVPDPRRAQDHYESFPSVGDDAVSEILRERGM